MKVGVIGSGTMGAGIAQVLAQLGHEVVMNARRQTSVDRGISTIDKQLSRAVDRERMTQEDKDKVMALVSGTTVLEELKDVDLIIEAAAEEMESKKDLFKRLDDMLRDDVIIATNTSSLSITEIAAATNRPD